MIHPGRSFHWYRWLLVIAGLYVLINFAIDMLYLLVDPRVRY